MKKEKLYEAIGDINENYINEAHMTTKKSRPVWLKWGALAACLCLIAALFPLKNYIVSETTPESSNTVVSAPSADYPAVIMVDGVLYYHTYEELAQDSIDENAILGHTTSYTDTMPEKNGETNFSRELGIPYAKYNDGLAVLVDGNWYFFEAKQ